MLQISRADALWKSKLVRHHRQFWGSMRHWSIALAVAAVACSPPMPTPAATSDSQREVALEAGRLEAAQLISGSVSDWHKASTEARIAYAMASVGALSPSAARDPATVRIFISCVDNLAETSASYDHLSDLSFHCAQSL